MKLIKIQVLYAILSRLSKREKLVFYIAAMAVLILLLDRLIIHPIYSNLKSLDKEISDKESALKNDLKILSQKDRILAEGTKYTSLANAPSSEEETVTLLLKEIENLATKTSVYLIDMKPAGTKEISGSKKYLVNVSCEGTMQQITDFMYNIESSSKLLKIERYQISPKSKGSSTAQCNMSISQIVMP